MGSAKTITASCCCCMYKQNFKPWGWERLYTESNTLRRGISLTILPFKNKEKFVFMSFFGCGFHRRKEWLNLSFSLKN